MILTTVDMLPKKPNYPIIITCEKDTYIVWYKDKQYAQGTWDYIAKQVNELKIHHDVQYRLDHTLPKNILLQVNVTTGIVTELLC